MEIKNNCFIKIYFIPNYFVPDDEPNIDSFSFEDRRSVEATLQNFEAMQKFIESHRWADAMSYCFDEIRPYYLPYYNPTMFKMTNIETSLDIDEGKIVIVITGITKKYSVDEINNMYLKSDALNKTWSDKPTKMTIKHLEDLTKDGFHKQTNAGEMFVPGLGQLTILYQDKMTFKVHCLE